MYISAHAAGMYFVLKGIQFNALGKQPFALQFNSICFLQASGSMHFGWSLEWALFLGLGFLVSSVQRHHEGTFFLRSYQFSCTPQKSANPPKAHWRKTHVTICSSGFIQVKETLMHIHDYNMLFFSLCLYARSLYPNSLSLWGYV